MRKQTLYRGPTPCHYGGLLLAMMWLIPGLAYSQITVNGTVTSRSNGETLPGVNVLVQGSPAGTVSDMEGRYTLNVPHEDGILVFSFIGFTSQEIAINGRTGEKTYSVVFFQPAKFNEWNYLAPIPQNVIDQNSLIEQNPGY